MYPSSFKHAQDLNNGSYIAPDISPVLRIQIAELERPDFVYVNMFGRDTDREARFRCMHSIESVVLCRYKRPPH